MNNPRRRQFANGNITEYAYPAEDEKRHTDKVLFSGGFCSFMDSNQLVFHYYTQDHQGNNRAVVNGNRLRIIILLAVYMVMPGLMLLHSHISTMEKRWTECMDWIGMTMDLGSMTRLIANGWI